MSIVINGSGSISGISAGGLPDGVVTTDDLASTLDLSGKTVTLPAGTGGKILQVVNATKTDTFSSARTDRSFVDITGLSVNITPSSASSKILVLATVHGGGAEADPPSVLMVRAVRDSTAVFIGDASASLPQASAYAAVLYGSSYSFSFVDSPNTTSELTYKLQAGFTEMYGSTFTNTTLKINYIDYSTYKSVRTASSIIVMEIAA